MSVQQHPRCPRCGSRLFQESDFRGGRLLYLWECSLGCSRQFEMSGGLLRPLGRERGNRAVRELAPAR